MLQFLLDVIFPKRCVGCRKFGSFLCENCFAFISYDVLPICPVCLKPSIGGVTHPVCKTRYTIDGLVSALVYKGIVKKLLYQFKYKPYVSSLESILGRLMQESLVQNETFYTLLKQKPILIPIPLHKTRERRRGYNHAALLGRHVAQYFSLEMLGRVLIRAKDTKPQFQLKKEDRLQNIRGAFAVNEKEKKKIRGKTILLIDDLATTCTTLREAARVLKRAGAASVWGVTFAKEL